MITAVGLFVASISCLDGLEVGFLSTNVIDGDPLGRRDGLHVGFILGIAVGDPLGRRDGLFVGFILGITVGDRVAVRCACAIPKDTLSRSNAVQVPDAVDATPDTHNEAQCISPPTLHTFIIDTFTPPSLH